ncbi:YdcF family protein [Saccharibacillus alkalitolerans]|uniref:YdcF family protein n=1 Tax=Saccharibacillus alkalitolerans TaxID=2705290 RepID=A0ABX0F8Y2_9BACL|nr:YdcF family protein [Saccharibacillus alkalitolerans]NGZ74472.1 YdcF family protein [Saccharibacillus alkalitolerans]
MAIKERSDAFLGRGPVHIPGNGRQRGGRWKKRMLLALLAGVILFILWTAYIQVRIGQGASLTREHDADVAIVLGARLWDNRPSPALKERLDAAYAGYERGDYPMLIVSGGLDNPQMQLTEAEGMAEYLEERGVPKSHIVLENEATSTYENLLFSRRIMEEKGMRTAAIVTHEFHGARARDIAEFLGYEDPQFVLAPTKELNIWQTRGRETLAFTKWLLDKASLPNGK